MEKLASVKKKTCCTFFSGESTLHGFRWKQFVENFFPIQTPNMHLKCFIRIRNNVFALRFQKINISTCLYSTTNGKKHCLCSSCSTAVKNEKFCKKKKQCVEFCQENSRRMTIFYADIFMSYNVNNCIICF